MKMNLKMFKPTEEDYTYYIDGAKWMINHVKGAEEDVEYWECKLKTFMKANNKEKREIIQEDILEVFQCFECDIDEVPESDRDYLIKVLGL